MRISRTQDESSVPDWLISGSETEEKENNQKIIKAGVNRINITSAQNVDDSCLVDECDQIEVCAKNNSTYFYNKTWTSQHIDHLQEYASVCGLKKDKFIGVDPSCVQKKASAPQQIRTASTKSSFETSLAEAIGDPFKIEERTDLSYMDKADWQKITKEAKLSEMPKTAFNGGILPLRGGEDCRISNEPKLPVNQNSLRNPSAIENLSTSTQEDTGVRLARENNERRQMSKVNHKEWEAEKISAMAIDGFKAQGVVFPTESLNASSGISSHTMSAYSKFDYKDMPEHTEGETIAKKNSERKASIQRDRVSDRSWEELSSNPVRTISDDFTQELEKRLKK